MGFHQVSLPPSPTPSDKTVVFSKRRGVDAIRPKLVSIVCTTPSIGLASTRKMIVGRAEPCAEDVEPALLRLQWIVLYQLDSDCRCEYGRWVAGQPFPDCRVADPIPLVSQ